MHHVFSCIYVTKLAEFLHGVAFVFLEERCYSIEDTRFFGFVRCLERSGLYTQKFGNGLFYSFFKYPTQHIGSFSCMLKVCFQTLFIPKRRPQPLLYCCAHEHTHTSYLIAPTLVLLSLLFITSQKDRPKQSKLFLEHLK